MKKERSQMFQNDFFSAIYHDFLAVDAQKKRIDADVFKPYREMFSDNENFNSRSVRTYPMVINKAQLAAIEEACMMIPGIWDIAIRSFDSPVAFGDYTQSPGKFHTAYLQYPADLDALMMRHDFFFEQGQAKLLEINVGSRIGGWDHDMVAQEVAQHADDVLPGIKDKIYSRSIITAFFISMLKPLAKLTTPQSPQINMMMYTMDVESAARFRELLLELIRQVPQLSQFDIILTKDVKEMAMDEQGNVSCRGEPVHLVMLPDATPSNPAIEPLMRARAMGKVVFVDDPMYLMFGNKAILALVHEPHVQQKLSKEQAEWVRAHVPWTVKANVPTVNYEGTDVELKTLLRQHQDDFVLKLVNGFSGDGVFVGRFCDKQQWLEAIEECCSEPNWIAQKYSGSDPIPAPDEQGETVDYTPVWGTFATNETYGGAQIRAFKTAKGGGVINSSKGAVEFVVFEER